MQFLTFLNDPYYYSIVLYILGILSLPIHIFGAYCILFQTPEAMKRVKWVMFNLHFWSCSLDILLNILGQPFILNQVFGGYSLGLLHLWNVNPGVMVYLMVTLLQFVNISTSAIFENRFFLLFAETSWWRIGRYPYHTMNFLLAIVYFIPTMMDVPDQTIARQYVFKTYPEISHFETSDHHIYVVSYGAKSPDWISIRMKVYTVILGIELFTFFFLLRWNMKTSVKDMRMSPKTLEAHRTFISAMNMQIAVPFIFNSSTQVGMIILSMLNISSLEATNFAYMTLSLHGTFGTLVMVYCHIPYRQYCKNLVRGKLKIFRTRKILVSVTCNQN